MRDSPNRPNGIEPAGSRSRSIPVPFFSPGSPRILSFSRPFRTVSVPSRSIFLSPSISRPILYRFPPSLRSPSISLEVAAREKKPPRLCVPLSPDPPFSLRRSHGPVSLGRSARGSGSCLASSTRVARSLCPLPSPRVISHSLALTLVSLDRACVHVSLCTRGGPRQVSREKETRRDEYIHVYTTAVYYVHAYVRVRGTYIVMAHRFVAHAIYVYHLSLNPSLLYYI